MMIIEPGCFGRTIASREPITVVPLKGSPGIGRDTQPVATSTFDAVCVSTFPSAPVTETSPALSIEASPRM